jgi:hypothetical protein
MLALPSWLPGWFWLMTGLVTITAAQRVAWAVRHLR